MLKDFLKSISRKNWNERIVKTDIGYIQGTNIARQKQIASKKLRLLPRHEVSK